MKNSEIERVLEEAGEPLCLAGIDRVYQFDSHTFLFKLYGGNVRQSLLISVKRNAPRFHLLFDRIHRDYLASTYSSEILNRHCSRTRIASVAFNGEAVELQLSRGAEYRLLVDFRSGEMRLREDDKVVFQLNRSEEKGTLSKPADSALSFSRFKAGHPGAGRRTAELSLNRRLSDEYVRQQNDVLARKVLSVMRGEQKKLGRLMDKLLDEQREVREKDQYRLKGELLKYNLSNVKKGDQSVELNGYDGTPLTVKLDPMLGPRENMDRYFQQYRKLKRRQEYIDHKIAFESKRRDALDELIDLVRSGEAVSITDSPLQFVESVDPDVLTRGLQDRVRRIFFPGQRPPRDEKKRGGFLRFVSKTGKTILVGRNARENEELTLHIARGNDLWIHAETGSGSHVILRYDRKGDFQDADIVDAAMLALYFSRYRNAESGDVVYTQRKFVRKPKNTPAGYVTYHNNKTKHIRVDQHILHRLLDSKLQGLKFQP